MRFFRRERPTESIDETMRRVAETYVEVGSVPGFRFDYTPRSLEDVDRFIDLLPRLPELADGSSVAVDSVTLALGAYVGEVMVRNLGARWVYHDEQQAAVIEVHPECYVYAIQKVHKRRVRGPEESVATLYDAARMIKDNPGKFSAQREDERPG